MTDWSALGGNPIPGDPGGIRAAASQVLSVADKIGMQSRLLQSVGAGGTSSWQGQAADGFRSVVGNLSPVMQNMVTSHHDAADALNTFAGQLEAFQASAYQLLGQAQQAQREITSAQSQIGALTPQVNAATAAYNQAATAPPAPPGFIGPVFSPSVATAYQNLTASQSQLAAAQQNCNHAQQSLSNAHSQASSLHAQANAAAQVCADKVNRASNWKSIMEMLAKLNDRAGWVLNAWGAWGFATTTDRLFNFALAREVFVQAKAAQNAAFEAWDWTHGGALAWSQTVAQENAAFRAEQAARTAVQESIRPAAGDMSAMGNLGRLGLGAGMLSDVVTVVGPASPSFGPGGVLGGNTDRYLAGANFVASGVALGASMDVGLATAALAIPGVNFAVGVVLVGTAAYFAGEFVYQHWDTITSGVSTAVDWAHHTVDHIGDAIGDGVSTALSWL